MNSFYTIFLCLLLSCYIFKSDAFRLTTKISAPRPLQALEDLADCATLAFLMEGRNDFPSGTSNKLDLWAKLLTHDFGWKPECILYYYDPTVRDAAPPKTTLRQQLPDGVKFIAVDPTALPKVASSLKLFCMDREGRCPKRVLFAYSGHGGNGVLQLPGYEQLQSKAFLEAIDDLHGLTSETKVFVFMQACMSGGFFSKHQYSDADLWDLYAPYLEDKPRMLIPLLGGMSKAGSAAVLGSIGALMDALAMCDASFCRTNSAECKPAEVSKLIEDMDHSIYKVVRSRNDEDEALIAWRDLQQVVSKWKDTEQGKELVLRLQSERLVGPAWDNECGTQEWDESWKVRHNMSAGPHLADCKTNPKLPSAFLTLTPAHFGCHKPLSPDIGGEVSMEDGPDVMTTMLKMLVHFAANTAGLNDLATMDIVGNHRGDEIDDDDLLAQKYAARPESILAVTSAMPSLICNTAMQLPKKTISSIRNLHTEGKMIDLVMSVLGIDGLKTKGLALPVGHVLADHFDEAMEDSSHFQYKVPLAQSDVYRLTDDGKTNSTGKLIKSGTPMAFGNMADTKLRDFFMVHS